MKILYYVTIGLGLWAIVIVGRAAINQFRGDK